jgi:hypothetical protein
MATKIYKLDIIGFTATIAIVNNEALIAPMDFQDYFKLHPPITSKVKKKGIRVEGSDLMFLPLKDFATMIAAFANAGNHDAIAFMTALTYGYIASEIEHKL